MMAQVQIFYNVMLFYSNKIEDANMMGFGKAPIGNEHLISRLCALDM